METDGGENLVVIYDADERTLELRLLRPDSLREYINMATRWRNGVKWKEEAVKSFLRKIKEYNVTKPR